MELIEMIGSLGFPIAVSVYLLIERSKSMKELTHAITDLTTLIKVKIKWKTIIGEEQQLS